MDRKFVSTNNKVSWIVPRTDYSRWGLRIAGKRREDIFWFRQLASEFNKAKLDEVFGSNRFDCILGFVNNEIMDPSSSSSSVSQGVDWNFIKMSRIKDKDYDMSALHLFSFNFHLRNEKISAKELDKYSKCNCETHSTPIPSKEAMKTCMANVSAKVHCLVLHPETEWKTSSHRRVHPAMTSGQIGITKSSVNEPKVSTAAAAAGLSKSIQISINYLFAMLNALFNFPSGVLLKTSRRRRRCRRNKGNRRRDRM